MAEPRRLGCVIALLAILAVASFTRTAEAATATWVVYPGFAVGGIYDFGWHFDEGPQFGARDYNYNSDQNGSVVFSARLTQNSAYLLRWRIDTAAQCTAKVVAQTFVFNTWVDIAGTEMHYLHLTDKPASFYTNTVQNNGDSMFVFLGHAGNCNIQPGQYHVHQSGDLSTTSRIQRAWYSNDTCWSDTSSQYTYQCPGGRFQQDNASAVCPPSSWNNLYAAISGLLARYYCELWSQRPQDYTQPAFTVIWS